MVEHPADYRWSSYRANAQGENSPLLLPHELYTALASDEMTRQHHYRELFRYPLDAGVIDEIRTATNGNFALGDKQFKEQVTVAMNRRVVPGQPGRPRR